MLKQTEGSHAVAEAVALCRPEVICAYPISPQTHIVEALGEIVKAECGILESDSPEEAGAKLEHALPHEDPDRPWLKARLAPLVGAPAEPASQEESFTAWRRTLEWLERHLAPR